ncbi:MAG: hypothetical protein ACKOSS_05340 [Planctomycetia bacterium]
MRPCAAEGDEDPLAGLSGAAARELAAELASDAMQGRKTGLPSASSGSATSASRRTRRRDGTRMR